MLHEIAPHKFHIEYSQDVPKEEDFFILCKGNKVYVDWEEGKEIEVPLINDLQVSIPSEHFRFLCKIDEKAIFTVDNSYVDDIEELLPKRYKEVLMWNLRKEKPQYLSFSVMIANRINSFYVENCFCGKCGRRMVPDKKERAMVCPDCGNMVFPKIPPSVIVLIRNGERTLLTRYQASHNIYRNYALVAGYVESGETPEEAVAREVMEEVGVKVKNITYFASQPWPISGALLLGYVCDLDGDDTIKRDDGELEEALWMERKDLPDRSQDVSLTSAMIEAFRLGRL